MTNDRCNMILYAANINALSDGRVFDSAYRAVSEERRKKTDALRFDKDKYLSLGAELLLRKALTDLGADIPEIKTLCNENGKPYLQGANDVFFNLSHSEDYVLCVVSDVEAGCDIEKIKDFKDSLAKRVLSDSEYADVQSKTTREEKNAAFFRYWTLRESYMKYTGLGLSLPFSDFAVTTGNGIGVIKNGEWQNVFLKEFRNVPGYACAVCAQKPLTGAELMIEDLLACM